MSVFSVSHPAPTLLIVDDQLDTVQNLGLFLEENGYSVTYACNLTEILDFLQSAQPHLILLDLLMQDTDGFEACKGTCMTF